MSNYSARTSAAESVRTVHLSDSGHQADVSIAVTVGNMAYEYLIRGRNYLWFPYKSPVELKQNPKFCGIPILAPWANRLDGDSYWANDRKYVLNGQLNNLRLDSHKLPIHGLLNFSPLWELIEAASDDNSAWSTSRLDFWRYPEMMAQFPFAHSLTVTHRLKAGVLSVESSIENRSAFPMPVALGFHPYFQLHDLDRDQWKLYISASEHLKLNAIAIPTGEIESLPEPPFVELRNRQFDDVYTKLARDADGFARFRLEGGKERVTVTYGPQYTVAVVFAPPTGAYVCFEPMSTITNGFNASHDGWYKGLQSVAPDGHWNESFWISALV